MRELLTTDVGLMSLSVVAGVVIIGGYLFWIFLRNSR
jgi:hypothetical protein